MLNTHRQHRLNTLGEQHTKMGMQSRGSEENRKGIIQMEKSSWCVA